MDRHTPYAAFSLIEVLVAIAITLGSGAVAFQLFHQSDRVFRDQALILEMQQTARMVASTIAEDIRLAGQSIPLNDVILPGTSASRLNIRTGFSGTETIVTTPLPFTPAIGVPLTVTVETTAGFSTGRQAFLWTAEGWARATIDSVSASSKTLHLTPSAVSTAVLRFTKPPAVSLDEAVAIYLDNSTNSVRRTTATNTENTASPSWAPANEIAANVSSLTFVYYDSDGMARNPALLGSGSEVTAIESRVTVRSSAPLSDGSRPAISLSIRSLPRNQLVR